jgi:hypothetical protein
VVLLKALEDRHKYRIEVARRERIEQGADLIVTRNLGHPKQGLGIIVSFGVLKPALVLQKRRRLGEKDAKGAQGGILDSIPGVGTLFAMVRQWSGPSIQDVFEDSEA